MEAEGMLSLPTSKHGGGLNPTSALHPWLGGVGLSFRFPMSGETNPQQEQ